MSIVGTQDFYYNHHLPMVSEFCLRVNRGEEVSVSDHLKAVATLMIDVGGADPQSWTHVLEDDRFGG